jgi:cytochrome bd-type quinol oxidase subunit 2
VNVVAAAIQKRKFAMNGNYNDHIGSLMEASFKMLTQRINRGTESPTPNLQPPSVKTIVKESPLLIENSASVPWSISVVLIVAATVLLWLLAKKRK